MNDLNDTKNRLQIISAGSTPVYALPNRFANVATEEYDRVAAAREAGSPVQWLTRRTLVNKAGELVVDENVVEAGDLRLTEAQFIRSEDGWLDPYSSNSPAELYAQGTARMRTGAGVPLDREPTAVDVKPRAGFADTYAESTLLHDLIVERVGGKPGEDDLAFDVIPNGTHYYGPVMYDDLMAKLIAEARNTPLPADDELLHVVTGTRV
jgi:hypothetical protein